MNRKKICNLIVNHHVSHNCLLIFLCSQDITIDVNCVDSLGRGALTLAIEAENLEMLELLVVMGVETGDALLHAINHEFIEAVELLLEHEELLNHNQLQKR